MASALPAAGGTMSSMSSQSPFRGGHRPSGRVHVGRYGLQHRAQRFAGDLELRLAVDLAPHRARGIEHDDGRSAAEASAVMQRQAGWHSMPRESAAMSVSPMNQAARAANARGGSGGGKPRNGGSARCVVSRQEIAAGQSEITAMQSLQISEDELSRLAERAVALALDHWAKVDGLPAYPTTGGELDRQAVFLDRGRRKGWAARFSTTFRRSRRMPVRRAAVSSAMSSVQASRSARSAICSPRLLNQNVTSWRSAPAAATIEQAVVGWLAEAVGCDGFKGSLCGGGSAANLMGLAMAREARLAANETRRATGNRLCVGAGASVDSEGRGPAAAWADQPTPDRARCSVENAGGCARSAIAADRQAGLTPIAIVATAGTVNIGAIDPLPELAVIADAKACGCMSTAPMAGWRRWRCPRHSRAQRSQLVVARRTQMAVPAARVRLPPLPRPPDSRETFSHSAD